MRALAVKYDPKAKHKVTLKMNIDKIPLWEKVLWQWCPGWSESGCTKKPCWEKVDIVDRESVEALVHHNM
jgi:hypothetical protein